MVGRISVQNRRKLVIQDANDCVTPAAAAVYAFKWFEMEWETDKEIWGLKLPPKDLSLFFFFATFLS